jgi:hypothetical protein
MASLSNYCIYTMLHSNTLHMQAAKDDSHSLTERRVWKTGSLLWAEAERSGEWMLIVFSGADRATGLFYWAKIDDVQIDYEKRQTTCRYSRLREISPNRPLSALRLKNGNRQLSDNYIRPYAICLTPSFLV